MTGIKLETGKTYVTNSGELTKIRHSQDGRSFSPHPSIIEECDESSSITICGGQISSSNINVTSTELRIDTTVEMFKDIKDIFIKTESDGTIHISLEKDGQPFFIKYQVSEEKSQ